MSSEWRINGWYLLHEQHGHFFIDTQTSGQCNATRVHGQATPHAIEPLGSFDNLALAMIACQQRIDVLDAQLVDLQREIDEAGDARESAA